MNLLHPGEVPDSMQELVETQRGILMESVISGDDALLERYLEGETISPAELERVLTPVLSRENCYAYSLLCRGAG